MAEVYTPPSCERVVRERQSGSNVELEEIASNENAMGSHDHPDFTGRSDRVLVILHNDPITREEAYRITHHLKTTIEMIAPKMLG